MLYFQNAVLALDSLALDIDLVENLIKFCPAKEEMTMLKCLNIIPVIIGKRICKIVSSNADDSHYRKFIEPRHCLRILLKLSDTRARNNKMTLMH
ncbi:Formin-like protein 14 [Camellia lanceoleosa]|uniref:Formin-like protein 14 n=1 Tax=Camellia lanceoleosa TaxID=1840588 RepID=A0ACC0G935_9ERIC|nr:Formin-like protein 14 [Camellia lanceoleosa]